MVNLIIVFIISILLAYCSDHHIFTIRISNSIIIDFSLVTMILIMGLYCGLRTAYNDTTTYISGFQNAITLDAFWESKPSILGNPLFYWFQSLFKYQIVDNYHLFFLIISFFAISCFILTIKRYSENFTFSILLFFCCGLYLLNFSAMKQCIAMAILALAIPKLLERKYARFYLLLSFAILFHTYAAVFAILPLFTRKPWTIVTYITILVVAAVLFSFEATIAHFLEYAEEIGKNISEDEVFDYQRINIFRLAVFGVPPALSFIFRRVLWQQTNLKNNLMINMSILSFLIMCLGLASGANLFGRCAAYFEIGAIIILPSIMKYIFTKRSEKIVTAIATICYIGFFLYDNKMFGELYRSIGMMEFLQGIF